jgi:hypothetical protein
MGRLALGREPAMVRAALPYGTRAETDRVIPIEPDELWGAVALRVRNSQLLDRIGLASRPRAAGLRVELRRNQARLGVLLERMSIESQDFDALVLDTPLIVLGVKLAKLQAEEPADAMALSNPADFVVSVQSRGYPYMDAVWVRADYSTADGSLRAFPLALTAQTSDLVGLEYSAGAPLSTFNVAVGSVVTLTMVIKLKSGRTVVRAFERVTVV